MMARVDLPRRRFMTIAAATVAPLDADSAGIPPLQWRGNALGGAGSITLYHPDVSGARRLIERCLDEIDRLEAICSLYQPESELCRLNRDGFLSGPSLDLHLLIAESLRFGAASGGAFDVTVQPLLGMYAAHFGLWPEDREGPAKDAIARSLAAVDYRAVELNMDGIRLCLPGAAITLNGIAQGYVADRVADLLREAGLRHVLVDVGELRASQGRPEGAPWRVGVRDPRVAGRVLGHVTLSDQAMATSAGDATRFDREGVHHHLVDPATGRSAQHYRAVCVTARQAMTADALSTAVSIMPRDAGRALLARFGACGWVRPYDGATTSGLEPI